MNRTAAALLLGALCLLAALAGATPPVSESWSTLRPGLELGFFRGFWSTPVSDTTIIVLRIDPEHWELRLICASETDAARNRSARDWCEDYGLVAATNAGMFGTDHRTHVGLLAVEKNRA